ncbi:AAA family ATPase [haloarchaeon 3A1-DGR]|nr:AAA family ATPase [haloarchaeon 3A1-DGR]
MITDPRVFTERHLPQRLIGRNADARHLSRILRPAVHDRRAGDALISGSSGVGKTALARFVLRRLNYRADVVDVHVQCLGSTRGDILREILQEHPDVDQRIHRGTPNANLLPLLDQAVSRPCIIVLDEGDDLPATGLVRELAGVTNVSVIAICHDPDQWLADVDTSVTDLFDGDQHLPLDTYSIDDLAEILDQRAQLGLVYDAVDWAVLEEIADFAAGKARPAIQTLRCAAEIAGEADRSQIRSVDVQPGYERAMTYIRERNLQSLSIHHHVLYELVRSGGEDGILSDDLHDRYDAVAEKVYQGREQTPIGQRQRRTKLRKLRYYELIDFPDRRSRRQYEAVDPSIESPLEGISIVCHT